MPHRHMPLLVHFRGAAAGPRRVRACLRALLGRGPLARPRLQRRGGRRAAWRLAPGGQRALRRAAAGRRPGDQGFQGYGLSTLRIRYLVPRMLLL